MEGCRREGGPARWSGKSRIRTQLLGRNVKRFRGGLTFKAYRRVYHSTLDSRVIKKNSSTGGSNQVGRQLDDPVRDGKGVVHQPFVCQLRQHRRHHVHLWIRGYGHMSVHVTCSTSAHVSTCQHMSAHVSICQHMSAHVSIRQCRWRWRRYHPSALRMSAVSSSASPCPPDAAYISIGVRIRQHMSAYVSMCQHVSAYVGTCYMHHISAYVSIHQPFVRQLCQHRRHHVHLMQRWELQGYLAHKKVPPPPGPYRTTMSRALRWLEFSEMCSGSEEGSYLRLIDFCLPQLQA